MQDLLAESNWSMVSIRSASDAFVQIAKAMPDAVLLDVHLETPESGWQVLEQLRADYRTGDIPVIVWSADMRELNEKREWMDQQSISALPKPFELDDLLTLLEKLAWHDHGHQTASSH